MDLGPHGGFILAAYVATALIVGALVLRAIVSHRVQRRALAELERRGVTRRSQATPPARIAGMGREAAGRG